VYIGKTGMLIGVIPFAKSPAVPAQSATDQLKKPLFRGFNSQLKNATTNPKQFPAFSRLGMFNMYPHARSIKSISKKKRSKNRTQDERMAAMVKITVKMNQAQIHTPSAFAN
jgi:hypothetical protein